MHTKIKKIPVRAIIYARDIRNITGRSERTARRMLRKIRLALGKAPDEFVTFSEFCYFYGIQEEQVKDFLDN
jgi:hypothetical protein